MKLQAKHRLMADEASDKHKETELEDSMDRVEEGIDQIKKGLPSKNNSTKVTEENQITKRRQILDLERKKQDLKEQKLRLKKD